MATVHKRKNKRGCIDAFVVRHGGKDHMVFLTANYRGNPGYTAKDAALDEARRINQGGKV